jgi:large subunit ribosomal protein L25
MSQITLAARVRKSKGKGAARKLRNNNQIPAIFYGPKTEPVMLVVDYPELMRVSKENRRENVILDLQIKSDRGTETRKAMIKDLLIDPIKNTYLHADFCEISMDKEIRVNIRVRLIGTPVGVTEGGVLQHIRRELTISCMPDKLIDSLDLDVSALDIGDSLHISDIKFPEGITSSDEGHITIAVVAAPTVAVEEKVEEEEEVEVGEEAASEEKEETEISEETQE